MLICLIMGAVVCKLCRKGCVAHYLLDRNMDQLLDFSIGYRGMCIGLQTGEGLAIATHCFWLLIERDYPISQAKRSGFLFYFYVYLLVAPYTWSKIYLIYHGKICYSIAQNVFCLQNGT